MVINKAVTRRARRSSPLVYWAIGTLQKQYVTYKRMIQSAIREIQTGVTKCGAIQAINPTKANSSRPGNGIQIGASLRFCRKMRPGARKKSVAATAVRKTFSI